MRLSRAGFRVMMQRFLTLALLGSIMLGCAPAAQSPATFAELPWKKAPATYHQELTLKSRAELVYKLQNLAKFAGFALGHQDTTAYGVGWVGGHDRSDVKDVCGSHAAVYGWDLFRIERGERVNGDGVNFSHLQTLIRNAHELGGINTISWHADNPLTGGDAWDNRAAISAALPSGAGHHRFVTYLDQLADYLDALRGAQGQRLPVILRLFHEQTGDWFWWGHQNSEENYKKMFEFSVHYLKEHRGLDNLVIAFSPDGGRVFSPEDLLYGYPGDEFVDVIGVDYYLDPGQDRLLELTDWLVAVAEAHGKVPVLAEFGPRDGIHQAGVAPDFMSRRVVEPLLSSSSGRRLAYVLAWRNARADHAFLPYVGDPAASDLRKVCALPQVLLTRDMSNSLFSPLEP